MNNAYVQGYSFEVDHCPLCGGETYTYHADGSNGCLDCGKKFYVIKKEESESGEGE